MIYVMISNISMCFDHLRSQLSDPRLLDLTLAVPLCLLPCRTGVVHLLFHALLQLCSHGAAGWRLANCNFALACEG